MWKIRNLKETVENKVFKFTDTEIKVREATNEEPWGPHGAILTELAQISFEYSELNTLMNTLWDRLKGNDNAWRRIYKTLLVIDYLVKFGSERVIKNVTQHIQNISDLINREFVDDDNKDQSKNVHHRAKEIINLLSDSNRLEYERRNAIKTTVAASDFISNSGLRDPSYQYAGTRQDGSIFSKIKNLKMVDGIKTIFMPDEFIDKDLEAELEPYSYKDSKTEPEKNVKVVQSPKQEEPKIIRAPSQSNLFDLFDNPTPSSQTVISKNDDFGDFTSIAVTSKPSHNDLIDLFFDSEPANNNSLNSKSIQPTSTFHVNQSSLDQPSIGYSQQNSHFSGKSNQGLFEGINTVSTNKTSPLNSLNFSATKTTQNDKTSLDVDALLSQNIDDLFSTHTPSSLNNTKYSFQQQPSSYAFNQGKYFNPPNHL